MNRLMCLLLVVWLASPGCADKTPSEVTVVSGLLDRIPSGTWDNTAALRRENAWLWKELNEATRRKRPVVTLSRIDRMEEVLLERISDLEDELKSQGKEVDRAEVAIEAQRVTIEVLQKLCRLYEDVLGSQKATIEILKKMCRLYDNEPYLKG